MGVQLQSPVKAVQKSSNVPANAGLLQRQCACGQHALGGECEECRKKKGILQRASSGSAPNVVPPIVYGVQRSPKPLIDPTTSSFMEPPFAGDFSQVPVHSKSLASIQTKLIVNTPGDIYEQEADRVADQVLAPPAHPVVATPPRIQRFSGQSNVQVGAAPASVDQALASPGRPLEPALQWDMEQRLGHDFSRVRVHADHNAAQSTLDVDAHAYTVGQHIVFSAGRYAPGTHDGMRLIAHELTHVVQQSGTGAGRGSPSGVLQRKLQSDASPAQPDMDLVPLQGSEGVPSDVDTAQAGVPEAAPVQQPPRNDIFVPATQSPGPQSPPIELSPGTPVGEALDAMTDAGTPANATQFAPVSAAPAADDSSMPRLTDLLSQPQPQAVVIDPGASPIEIASESVALDEVSQDSRVDRGALFRTLALSANEARNIINSHSTDARLDIDRRAKESSQKLKEQTKTADEAVRALADKRRTQLDKTILAHDTRIRWLETQCKETATTYADNAKRAQIDGFGWYRIQLADAFDSWVRRFEKLNEEQSNRLTQETDRRAKLAWNMAKNYDRQYIQSYSGQSEERKEVQHDAVYEVAEAYGTEIQKAKTEVLPEIARACAQVKPELDKARNEALVEFDKGLPIVLSGIDKQLAAALQDISMKAAESRETLAKCAFQMRKRVNFLEETALERNAAFRTKIDGQIETGSSSVAREFRHAAPKAMEPIAAIVDEAVGILTNSDQELDADASRQFVDEVVYFSLDAADATGVMFAAARDASVGTLAGALPFAKRGLAAGKQDLESALHTEGVENEAALIRFSTEADGYIKSPLTTLDETFNAAVVEAGTKLGSMLNDTRAKLREPMEQTEEQIRQSVNEVLSKQNHAIWNLPRVMHNAAREAAWRYDHPYLKHVVTAVEVALGFALIVGALMAFVLGLPVLVGAAAAAVILAVITIVGAFFIGYFGAKAYDERRQAGASRTSALFGAVADVTGINDVRRAFTDPKMAPFDRGMAWGGFWLNLFGLGSSASRFVRVIKVRLPNRFINPFRLKRSMIPAAMPEGRVVPTVPETPAIPERIGYQLPHQKLPEPELPTAPVPTSKATVMEPVAPTQAKGGTITSLAEYKARRAAASKGTKVGSELIPPQHQMTPKNTNVVTGVAGPSRSVDVASGATGPYVGPRQSAALNLRPDVMPAPVSQPVLKAPIQKPAVTPIAKTVAVPVSEPTVTPVPKPITVPQAPKPAPVTAKAARTTPSRRPRVEPGPALAVGVAASETVGKEESRREKQCKIQPNSSCPIWNPPLTAKNEYWDSAYQYRKKDDKLGRHHFYSLNVAVLSYMKEGRLYEIVAKNGEVGLHSEQIIFMELKKRGFNSKCQFKILGLFSERKPCQEICQPLIEYLCLLNNGEPFNVYYLVEYYNKAEGMKTRGAGHELIKSYTIAGYFRQTP